MDESHECGDGFLTAQCDPAEALEFVEEAFDLMAFSIEAPVDRRLVGPTRIRLDMRGCAKIMGNEGA